VHLVKAHLGFACEADLARVRLDLLLCEALEDLSRTSRRRGASSPAGGRAIPPACSADSRETGRGSAADRLAIA
jgi:hypothetical protein